MALCTGQLDAADTTEALLKTFALVEPPEDETYCLVATGPPRRNQQLGYEVHKSNLPAVRVISGMRRLVVSVQSFTCSQSLKPQH